MYAQDSTSPFFNIMDSPMCILGVLCCHYDICYESNISHFRVDPEKVHSEVGALHDIFITLTFL